MNKNGFLATIFLALVIVIFIIGLFFYFKLRTTGLEFKTGNIIIDLHYNNTTSNKVQTTLPEPNLTTEQGDSLENSSDNTTLLDDYSSSNDYEDLTNLSE